MIYRKRFVGIRLTEEEYRQICKQAKMDTNMLYKNGELNLSGYFRMCALQGENHNKDTLQKMKNDVKNLTYQFRKIGVNVNQATKKINSGYGTGKASEEMQEELRKLNNLFEIFLEMMKEREEDNGGNENNEY